MAQEFQLIHPEQPKAILSLLSTSQVTDWGVTSIGAPYAWRYTKGKGVTVAVLDTGCATHPDLPQGMCREAVRTAWDGNDTKAGHGTFCAGVVGATDNGIGVVGVAPECTLVSVQVMSPDGVGSFEDIEHGILKAISLGADVVSMSLGCSQTPPNEDRLKSVIAKANDAGVILVAAAGNEYDKNNPDSIDYPARYDGVIPVAAIDRKDTHAPFSSTGKELAHGVSMPGVDIYSTWLKNGYATLSGTSMATPMLAGFIALILAYHSSGNHATPIPPKGNPGRFKAVTMHLAKYVRPLGSGDTFGIGVCDGSKIGGGK